MEMTEIKYPYIEPLSGLKEALSVFPKEEYYHPYVKALEEQRRLYTANLGVDMGKDWFSEKGDDFRRKSLTYYVRKFLQATMIRQFRMAAEQTRGIIKTADDTSGVASMDLVQMLQHDQAQVEEVTREKLPPIFMERMREQAKERREKARRISRGQSATRVGLSPQPIPVSSSSGELQPE